MLHVVSEDAERALKSSISVCRYGWSAWVFRGYNAHSRMLRLQKINIIGEGMLVKLAWESGIYSVGRGKNILNRQFSV